MADEFRGLGVTLGRETVGYGVYFSVYDALVQSLSGDGGRVASPALAIGFGATAGVALWTSIFPLDVVKSRIQASDGKTGFVGAVRGVWREAGLLGFYRGFGPCLVRAVPVNAGTFLAFEVAHSLLRQS